MVSAIRIGLIVYLLARDEIIELLGKVQKISVKLGTWITNQCGINSTLLN